MNRAGDGRENEWDIHLWTEGLVAWVALGDGSGQ
jgi:hypothetical protein